MNPSKNLLERSIKSFYEKVSEYSPETIEKLGVVLPSLDKKVKIMLYRDLDKIHESPKLSTMIIVYFQKLTETVGIWNESIKDKKFKEANFYYQKIKEYIKEIEDVRY